MDTIEVERVVDRAVANRDADLSRVNQQPDDHDLVGDTLTATDSFSEWLSVECCAATPYQGGMRHWNSGNDAAALVDDYLNAQSMSTPALLALALGLTAKARARIAAMDELARRFAAEKFPGAQL